MSRENLLPIREAEPLLPGVFGAGVRMGMGKLQLMVPRHPWGWVTCLINPLHLEVE
jgi:hypothetical protein